MKKKKKKKKKQQKEDEREKSSFFSFASSADLSKSECSVETHSYKIKKKNSFNPYQTSNPV